MATACQPQATGRRTICVRLRIEAERPAELVALYTLSRAATEEFDVLEAESTGGGEIEIRER
ncbi:MAG: hypothetical protein HOY79_16795 [Streptomyces sp.]|nr:hypothetical protein [Streptomyces sp.]